MSNWGYSLHLDCHDCDLELIKSKENIEAFVIRLVKDIDMVAYGEPQIVHFGSGDKEGYTLVQLIETSSITAHFSNDTKAAFIDVFSCKLFDPEIVVKLTKQFFGAKDVRNYFLTRN